ncbi:diguanylate cyclase (GGDEF)-like protein/PAS domain S-box-containing protein [Neobacillus sp. B4I6]
MKMKYKGSITAFILVLITNCLYITYYFSRDGYVDTIEFIGLPIMLTLAWWCGKQFDKVKLFMEKDRNQSKELQRINEQFQVIYEKSPIGITLMDKNSRPVMANPKLQDMLGYSEKELQNITFGDISHPDDTTIIMGLLNELLEGKIDHYQLEKRYYRKDGQLVWGKVTSSLFPGKNDELSYVIGMVTDITERKVAEQHLIEAYQEMEDLSNRDGLTGIANRRYFDEYLIREWRQAVRYSKPLSLIMLDIDSFKEFNDTYGHMGGDECLKQVASILEETVKRRTDSVARYGGEEFAIILPETVINDACIVAEKIRSTVEELHIPHVGSNVSKFLTVSVGAATIIPDFNSNPEDLIREADRALYQAKQKGRNRVESYSKYSERKLLPNIV